MAVERSEIVPQVHSEKLSSLLLKSSKIVATGVFIGAELVLAAWVFMKLYQRIAGSEDKGVEKNKRIGNPPVTMPYGRRFR